MEINWFIVKDLIFIRKGQKWIYCFQPDIIASLPIEAWFQLSLDMRSKILAYWGKEKQWDKAIENYSCKLG